MISQKTRLKKGLAVGSAVIVGASLGDALRYTPAIPSLTIPDGVSSASQTTLQTGEINADTLQMKINIPVEETAWRSSDTRRFKELAMKRAALEATAEENQEFIELQHRRRLYESKISAEEILSEWRRRRFVTQLLGLLSCNVSFFQPEDQARIRAFGRAPRP